MARECKCAGVEKAMPTRPGRPGDTNRPFVLHRGATVENLANVIHGELRRGLLYAVRWPAGAAPLRVAHDYVLRDGDVIELHTG
jgi:ribosome-interacting GTPase 1